MNLVKPNCDIGVGTKLGVYLVMRLAFNSCTMSVFLKLYYYPRAFRILDLSFVLPPYHQNQVLVSTILGL